MNRTLVLWMVISLLVTSAFGQRRDIGNSGRGGSLSDTGHTQRPARTETAPNGTSQQTLASSPVRPHPIPPSPVPVCGGGTIVGQPVILMPTPHEPFRGEDGDDQVSPAVLYDCATRPESSGFDFSAGKVVPCDDDGADVWFTVDDDGPAFVVRPDTDIQDIGEAQTGVVTFPPTGGWSEARRVLAQPDHQYLVWTWDDHRFGR